MKRHLQVPMTLNLLEETFIFSEKITNVIVKCSVIELSVGLTPPLLR